MEAKDTVMSDEELNSWHLGRLESRKKIAQAQAEITWDIAKQVGFEIGLEQGRAEGMRKVVEWEQTHHFHSAGFDSPSGATLWMRFDYNERQAKLKEWGIGDD